MNKAITYVFSLIFFLIPFLLHGQEIDSTLLAEIERQFDLDKPVNIGFRFYYHHPYEDLTNQRNLNTILQYLKENQNQIIELRCHSDCQGKYDYNLQFTQRQSVNIRNWFTAQGIDKKRIIPIGKGGEFPMEPCQQCECEDGVHRSNRRIEICKSN